MTRLHDILRRPGKYGLHGHRIYDRLSGARRGSAVSAATATLFLRCPALTRLLLGLLEQDAPRTYSSTTRNVRRCGPLCEGTDATFSRLLFFNFAVRESVLGKELRSEHFNCNKAEIYQNEMQSNEIHSF